MTAYTYDPEYTKWLRVVYSKLIELGVEDMKARRLAQNQRDLYEDNYQPEIMAEIIASNLEYGVEIGESQMG